MCALKTLGNCLSARFLSEHRPLQSTNSSNKKYRYLFASIGFGCCAAYFVFEYLPNRDVISPHKYVTSKLISSENSGPNTKLVKIVAPLHFPSNNSMSAVWSVYIKDDDLQVERPYTALNGVDEDGNMLFWVKKYPRGEVSRWIHAKVPGDRIELRGPVQTWAWKEDTWDDVVMISGGTGITPFIQLFYSTITKPGIISKTRFTLLHSSRIPEELPPFSVLEPLINFAAANSTKFNVHFFVDENKGSAAEFQLKQARITESILREHIHPKIEQISFWRKLFFKPFSLEEPPRRILFLVCGPERMINALSGPYGNNFSQGSIGGVLGNMGYSSHEVYKL